MTGLLRRLRTDRSGSAVLEAALVAPMLISLGFGCADAGNLLIERHRIKTGLSAGARLLARAPDPPAMEAAARNLAVTGSIAGGSPKVRGWTADEVQVSYRLVANSGAYAGGSQVRVIRLQTQHDYSGFGLLSLVGLDDLTVAAAHEERWTG